jgi:4'-phosphopantetheinyl transferase
MIISVDEIHIWYVYDEDIVDSHLLSQYHNILNREEQLQQKRFYFKKHRHQYLITRAMVRSVLSLYVNEITPEKWEFKKNDYGKPFINNSSLEIPLCFNISHSDKLVVMAVTLDQEIGVDVEYLPRRGKNLEIATSFFSPIEVKQLLELSPEKQKNRFFDLWTLKEAYIKACGMGLSIPLDHFSFSFSEHGKIKIDFKPERNDQSSYWQFWQIHPNNTHKVAMAVKGDKIDNPYSISMRKLAPFSDIIEENYPIAHGSIITA